MSLYLPNSLLYLTLNCVNIILAKVDDIKTTRVCQFFFFFFSPSHILFPLGLFSKPE